jgi:hypothetical protein
MDALIALRRVLTTRKQFSLCANGGSSTAGGGGTGGAQFHVKFVDYMNSMGVTPSDTKVSIIERGHGTRHSLHSAMLADSYFPPNIDILLWEFATNDVGYRIRDKKRKSLEEKNALILWLEQVSKIKPRPPLVVLAYMWTTPFNIMGNGKVRNDVFLSHQRVAAEYEFVVGHVNLASYVEELQWGNEFSKKFLLADLHHPSRMGHAVLAHLLLDLVIDEERQVSNTRNYTTPRTPFQWACGTESTEKRLIQNRVEGKHPLASFTMEIPRNEEVGPGMLVLSSESKTITSGKQDPKRKDRQRALKVPCCRDKQTLAFVVPHNKNIAMQVIQLGAPGHPSSGIRVFLDSQNVSADLISTGTWDCLWNFKDVYPNLNWIALENERNVSSIQFCSTMCDARNNWSVQSLVIY